MEAAPHLQNNHEINVTPWQTSPNRLVPAAPQNPPTLLRLHLHHSIALATADPPQPNRVLGHTVARNPFHHRLQARGLHRRHLLLGMGILDIPLFHLVPLHPPPLPQMHLHLLLLIVSRLMLQMVTRPPSCHRGEIRWTREAMAMVMSVARLLLHPLPSRTGDPRRHHEIQWCHHEIQGCAAQVKHNCFWKFSHHKPWMKWGCEIRSTLRSIDYTVVYQPIVQLMNKAFSRQKFHKTVLWVAKTTWSRTVRTAYVKPVGLFITASVSCALNSTWHLTWLKSIECISACPFFWRPCFLNNFSHKVFKEL